jgi:hypothetical protein
MSGTYPGADVVRGIAADAFYAKGASNVAQLFEIMRAIETGRDVYAARAETPIWVQGLPIDRSGTSTVLSPAPNVSGHFPILFPPANLFQDEKCCPHCFELVQLAIVRQSREPDKTLFPTSEWRSKGANLQRECDDSQTSRLGKYISHDQYPD